MAVGEGPTVVQQSNFGSNDAQFGVAGHVQMAFGAGELCGGVTVPGLGSLTPVPLWSRRCGIPGRGAFALVSLEG